MYIELVLAKINPIFCLSRLTFASHELDKFAFKGELALQIKSEEDNIRTMTMLCSYPDVV